MKILTILGARPQFIKAAVVSRAIRSRDDVEEVIVHTGQHFDNNMSGVFFEQLEIPRPQHNLGISNLSHGAMTGRMLEQIEGVIQHEKPDWLLVYGDTNSTLAGALAAAKLHLPVAHVEAGLRSHNLKMPEEINRALTDRISSFLLCPTVAAVENLEKEGFPFATPSRRLQRIENVGDVMFDAALYYGKLAIEMVNLEAFGLNDKGYALCTLHRQENTDDRTRLREILMAIRKITETIPVVFPIHPRTRKKLHEHGLSLDISGLSCPAPLPYLEMQRLQIGARFILTDSGGVQKEAFFHRVPCITLREETEWVETVALGANQLVGSNTSMIMAAVNAVVPMGNARQQPYGDGTAAQKICDSLLSE